MIPEELALDLIKRFAALRGWRGLESAAKAELGRWLAKIAETPWQATQAVETWLQEQTNLPTPAEIVEYVRQAPTQAPKQQKVNCLLGAALFGLDGLGSMAEVPWHRALLQPMLL